MKLTEAQIDEILDKLSDYISDNLWNEFSTDWVEDYLNDCLGTRYDKEDVIKILESLTETQHQMQEEALLEEQQDLYYDLDEYLGGLYNNLRPSDIGKVLVKLANSYLNDSYE